MTEESPESRRAAPAADEDVDDETAVESEANDAADAEGAAGVDSGNAADAGGEANATAAPEAGERGDESDAESDSGGLASRVAEYDGDLADEVAELESKVAAARADLEAREERIEELESALKRSKADFKNYKKRAKKREEEIRERATEDFVGRVVSVRDNLVRALDQDEEADIRPGVESTLEEFDRILEEENVTPIDPDAGEEVDPTRHEVLMRVDEAQQEGTVVDVYRPGYEMAGSVIREAQVTVSTGEGDGATDETDGSADES